MLFLLQSDVTVNNWPDYNVFGQFFLPVISFVFVCALAYFATRWISGAKITKNPRTRDFSIWDSISVGYQKYLQIIKVGDKFFLIAVTKDRVSLLAELPDTSVLNLDSSDSDTESFNGPFDKLIKKILSK